ncbi:hypothetical protein AA101099_3106 [Neoasaia chiangmaiensis NBRC 101099]|uniref:Uncharacterized protein n=1 Tax=Neoasaia chiangmaiensis TaxID=320497 RepID=A0A1U9KNN3_9PROT|nr:mitochondrial fission ELM1 family protein [Neoasaia chiangmaiensis]AQS87320.1 hypothetical protein A0U93_04510 [Neoasaia chiangmaiensis]GBR43138.1 hypothetical protein AA101099_3106 [Neoasaia chiangmaiensis NBRC 101099]GEN16072.1 hypothetical protein NCH01_25030 [Neoasaia chiangmaiensis]
MTIAIIAEDFAGMRAQAAGLAERAGQAWTFHPVTRRGIWRHVPARYCPWPLASMAPFDIPAETRLLLSVGGTGGVAGAALARRLGLPIVQIQNPRMALGRFDMIVANHHDGVEGPNIVLSRNAMHGVTQDKLSAARDVWCARLRKPGRRLIVVLIGGANGRFVFGVPEARALGDGLVRMARESGAVIAVTPSRRTDSQALAALRACLVDCDASVWDGTGENPYLGMLGCADMIVVTMDSVSMVSEAVATCAPVQVVALPGRSRRISAFIGTLIEAGRVRPFTGHWSDWSVTPLDDTTIAAGELRRRLGDRL